MCLVFQPSVWRSILRHAHIPLFFFFCGGREKEDIDAIHWFCLENFHQQKLVVMIHLPVLSSLPLFFTTKYMKVVGEWKFLKMTVAMIFMKTLLSSASQINMCSCSWWVSDFCYLPCAINMSTCRNGMGFPCVGGSEGPWNILGCSGYESNIDSIWWYFDIFIIYPYNCMYDIFTYMNGWFLYMFMVNS